MFTPDKVSPVARCLQIAHRRGQLIRREREKQVAQPADDQQAKDAQADRADEAQAVIND